MTDPAFISVILILITIFGMVCFVGWMNCRRESGLKSDYIVGLHERIDRLTGCHPTLLTHEEVERMATEALKDEMGVDHD